MAKQPNIVLMGVDSLLATHMSCYGYHRQTTPHIDKFAEGGTLFEKTYSAHIPTTSAYASMLTGMDTFGTQVVALRHKGPPPRRSENISRNTERSSAMIQLALDSVDRVDAVLIPISTLQDGGPDDTGRSPKAENLNRTTLPELNRLIDQSDEKPFFLFLRHMDPHSPYLPPAPYERMFYHGDECDPSNTSMEPVMSFKPFCDYFASWMPVGITDKDYVIAQYDGAIAYMDACIQTLFNALETRGVLDETIVIINGDHGETLYDHECWFDHHGLYDVTLHVPLIIRYPGRIPAGKRVSGYNQHKDLVSDTP